MAKCINKIMCKNDNNKLDEAEEWAELPELQLQQPTTKVGRILKFSRIFDSSVCMYMYIYFDTIKWSVTWERTVNLIRVKSFSTHSKYLDKFFNNAIKLATAPSSSSSSTTRTLLMKQKYCPQFVSSHRLWNRHLRLLVYLPGMASRGRERRASFQ